MGTDPDRLRHTGMRLLLVPVLSVLLVAGCAFAPDTLGGSTGEGPPQAGVTVAVVSPTDLLVSWYDRPAGDGPCQSGWTAAVSESTSVVTVVLTDDHPGTRPTGLACPDLAIAWMLRVHLSSPVGERSVQVAGRTTAVFRAAVLGAPTGLTPVSALPLRGGGCLTSSDNRGRLELCLSDDEAALDDRTAGSSRSGTFTVGSINGDVLSQAGAVLLRWTSGGHSFLLSGLRGPRSLTRDEAVRLAGTVQVPAA